MSTAGTPNAPLDFVRAKAHELEQLTNSWFLSLAGQESGSTQSARDLVKCVNGIGAEFRVLGGAVGIVNRETNRLQHWKSYPGDITASPLFPYPPPPRFDGENELHVILAKLPALLATECKDPGGWINALFEIRRKHQQYPAAEPAKMTGTDPIIFVPPGDIRKQLQGWIDVLAIVGYVSGTRPELDLFDTRLSVIMSQLPVALTQSQEWASFERRTTVVDCINHLVSCDTFRERWPHSVECMFFCGVGDEALDLLRRFLGSIRLSEVRFALGMQAEHKWSALYPDLTIPELLEQLHFGTVPLLEYLVLHLLWGIEGNIYHIVWPFLKTLMYYPSDDTPEALSFPGVLLLTLRTDPAEDWGVIEVKQYLAPFILLMRLALEPIADRAFYGGIERKRLVSEGEQAKIDDISHEIRQVASALMGGWSLDPDEPLQRALDDYFHRLGYAAADLPVSSRVCPEPRLIAAAAKITQLWTGSRDPLGLFDEPPRNLEHVMRGIWEVVLDSASGLLCRKLRFDVPDHHRKYLQLQRTLGFAFSFGKMFAIEPYSLLAPSENDDPATKRKWVYVFQVLLAKFKDVIRHAHPERDRSIRVTATEDVLRLVIRNCDRPRNDDDIEEPCVRELYKALGAALFFSSRSHGRRMIERLGVVTGGFVDVRYRGGDSGMYFCEICFDWRKQLESL